jgi:hypothetical protein
MIYSMISRKPLDIIAWFDIENEPFVLQIFEAYDAFLGILSDPGQRKHLEELSETEAESDDRYQNAREISHRFRDAILDLFFSEKLYPLTRLYGVF